MTRGRRLLSGVAVFALALANPIPSVAAAPTVPDSPLPTQRPAVNPVFTSIPADAAPATVGAQSTSAKTPAGDSVLAEVAPRDVSFNLVGASWTSMTGSVTVQVRTQAATGWSDWTTLDPEAEPGTKETTEPLYVGDSTGLELRAVGPAGSAITGLAATAVSSPAVAADSTLQKVQAQSVSTDGVPAPAIISRAAWGADENLKASSGADCMTPKIDDTVQAAVIHHTAGSNDYTADQSASIVRGIYAYHVQGNGWCDIGYNFLVDKYGQLFEGRFGGINLPIHGAHASSWNTNTMGVSFMMNSSLMPATEASLNSAISLLAWKLGSFYRDPLGSTTLVGATQPVIFGHGDVMATDCPGTSLHSLLQQIRDRVATAMAGRQNTPLLALWASRGGNSSDLGPVHIAERTVGTGRMVTFLNGGGYERADANVFWLGGGLDYVYTQQGGPTGALGWPTSSQVTSHGIATATFEHGTLTYPVESGTATFGGDSTYHGVTPARILDTRASGSVGAGSMTSFAVAGVAGVPTDATAVTLNVTTTNAKAPGFLTVWPSGVTAPVVSNLNFVAGQTVPNLVTVSVGANGKVSVLNGSPASSDVVVDISGYYSAGSPSSGGGTVATTPTRILDTRVGLGASGAVAPNADLGLMVRSGVVPADATAVLLNLTVDQTGASGWLAAYPAGVGVPTVSNVNFSKGQTTANLALVKVGTNGVVMLRNGSTGFTHLIADVVGYVTGSGTGGGFRAADQPTRILDTRAGIGLGGPVAGNAALVLPIAGHSGVPNTGVKAVVLNVTATDITRAGYVTIYPSGQNRPTASNLNFRAGQVVANQVVVGVGSDGKIVLQNLSAGSLSLIADIAGYIV